MNIGIRHTLVFFGVDADKEFIAGLAFDQLPARGIECLNLGSLSAKRTQLILDGTHISSGDVLPPIESMSGCGGTRPRL